MAEVKIRRIVAGGVAAAMIAGAVAADYTGVGRLRFPYEETPAYSYLDDSMDILSYGWIRDLIYSARTLLMNEDTPEGSYRRACKELSEGDLAEAEAWMQRRLEMDDVQPGHHMELACIRSLKGDAEGAAHAAQQAVALAQDDLQLQLLCYEFSLDAGDHASAAMALEACARLNGDETLYEEAADLYLEAGNYAQSAACYERALDAVQDTGRIRYMLGSARMLLGQYDRAIAEFELSDMAGRNYSIGVCEMALGAYDRAAQALEASIAVGEQPLEGRLLLAVCLLEQEDYSRVLALLDEYLQAGGETGEIAYYRALASYMLGDYAAAAEDYQRSIDAGIAADESLFGAAQSHYALGNYERAARLFEQCAAREIQTTESLYYMGMALAAIGDSEGATDALTRALAFGPETEE